MPIKISQQQQYQQQQQQYHQQQHNNEHNYQEELHDQQQQQDYHSQQEEQQRMMLQTIKMQLIDNNITTMQQYQHILKDQQQQNNVQITNSIQIANNHNYNDHKQSLYKIITHLIATIMQQNQHSLQQKQLQMREREQIMESVNKNDNCIISALQLFHNLALQLSSFSHIIYNSNTNNNINMNSNNINMNNNNINMSNNRVPLQVCRHFRQVYELSEQLSSLFNKYQFSNQQIIQRRNILIQEQIKIMQQVFNTQLQQQQKQLQSLGNDNKLITNNTNNQHIQSNNNSNNNNNIINNNNKYYPLTHPHPNNLPSQTSQYILSLRQQINHLHQTLIQNDQQFTHQIQNYNKTIRQMTQTIKAYQSQIAKIIHYQLKLQQMEKIIVRFRQEKYKNQIVIENMAKKIRNYERDMKGDSAFLSPQRQRLISPPQSRYSMLNSKLSVVNSVKREQQYVSVPMYQKDRGSVLLIGSGLVRK